MFGDPHIITLDQRAFIFNGQGEYTLVKIPDTANPESPIFTVQVTAYTIFVIYDIPLN